MTHPTVTGSTRHGAEDDAAAGETDDTAAPLDTAVSIDTACDTTGDDHQVGGEVDSTHKPPPQSPREDATHSVPGESLVSRLTL